MKIGEKHQSYESESFIQSIKKNCLLYIYIYSHRGLTRHKFFGKDKLKILRMCLGFAFLCTHLNFVPSFSTSSRKIQMKKKNHARVMKNSS